MPRKPLRRRPKQARSGETFNVIVDAAAQVLIENGYAKATTNRIAERAGVSVGSLYQYFDNKDAIFVAVMQSYINQLATVAREIPLSATTSLVEQLEQITVACIRARPEGPQLLFLLSHTNSAEFREILDGGKANIANFLGERIRAESNTVDSEKLNLRLQIAMDAVEGLLFNAASKLTLERFAKELSSLVGPYLLVNAREPAN